MYINLNGLIQSDADACLPYENGSFRYGFGLFETILVCDGVIQLYQYHSERLLAGIKQLKIKIDAQFSKDWLHEQVLQTVKANHLEKLCRVRLQVYAGNGSYNSTTLLNAGFVIACFPIADTDILWNENGLNVLLATGIQKSSDTLSNLKSCSALLYIMAAQQAMEAGKDDALICNIQGNIIESTIANIFWVKDGNIFTPPLNEGCVAGVMRRYIIEKAEIIYEKPLTMNDLLHADEVFLTNAIKRLKWISSFAYVNYGCTRTKELYANLFA